jgi:hypothetical protein
MKKIGETVKPFVITLLFVLIVFSLFTNQNLKNEIERASDGWSRSLPFDTGVLPEVRPVVICSKLIILEVFYEIFSIQPRVWKAYH